MNQTQTIPGLEDVARACHEANRSYCNSIGDNSQPAWEDAPDWQKQSAVNGVKHALENPDATPEDSHKSWLKEKEADGWKFGEVKDPDKKEHPCFVPYEQLPEEQRKKDEIFLSVVNDYRHFFKKDSQGNMGTQEVSRETGADMAMPGENDKKATILNFQCDVSQLNDTQVHAVQSKLDQVYKYVEGCINANERIAREARDPEA